MKKMIIFILTFIILITITIAITLNSNIGIDITETDEEYTEILSGEFNYQSNDADLESFIHDGIVTRANQLLGNDTANGNIVKIIDEENNKVYWEVPVLRNRTTISVEVSNSKTWNDFKGKEYSWDTEAWG